MLLFYVWMKFCDWFIANWCCQWTWLSDIWLVYGRWKFIIALFVKRFVSFVLCYLRRSCKILLKDLSHRLWYLTGILCRSITDSLLTKYLLFDLHDSYFVGYYSLHSVQSVLSSRILQLSIYHHANTVEIHYVTIVFFLVCENS